MTCYFSIVFYFDFICLCFIDVFLSNSIAIFQEQIEWAVAEGADYIVAETFSDYAEAASALECIKEYGKHKMF